MAGGPRKQRAPTRHFHLPSAVRASPARIDAGTARRLVSDEAVLVDVRRREDPAMTLAGSVRISPDEIPERLDELPRDSPIVLACG